MHAVPRDVKVKMELSNSRAERLVYPKYEEWRGGRVTTNVDCVADINGGVDAWHVLPNGETRPLAIRVQSIPVSREFWISSDGPISYRSFTIRATEAARGIRGVRGCSRTVQAYVNASEQLIGMAVVPTKQLIKMLMACRKVEARDDLDGRSILRVVRDDMDFFVVPWSMFYGVQGFRCMPEPPTVVGAISEKDESSQDLDYGPLFRLAA